MTSDKALLLFVSLNRGGAQQQHFKHDVINESNATMMGSNQFSSGSSVYSSALGESESSGAPCWLEERGSFYFLNPRALLESLMHIFFISSSSRPNILWISPDSVQFQPSFLSNIHPGLIQVTLIQVVVHF